MPNNPSPETAPTEPSPIAAAPQPNKTRQKVPNNSEINFFIKKI